MEIDEVLDMIEGTKIKVIGETEAKCARTIIQLIDKGYTTEGIRFMIRQYRIDTGKKR